MSQAAASIGEPRDGVMRRVSDALVTRHGLLLLLLLIPPLLWLGVVYLGSLFALLAQSFFSIDEYLRDDRSRADAQDLRRAAAARQSRHHPAHGPDRHHGDGAGGDHRFPDCLLRGPLRARAHQGAVLSRGDDAAVVELSGQDLRLEASARQGRRGRLGHGRGRSVAASRRGARPAGDRRPVAVGELPRHGARVPLSLDPVHGAAGPGVARARAGNADRSLERSRRDARADVSHRHPAARACPA